MALPLALIIHPSAWNRNSANFAYTEFCELRVHGVLRSSGPRNSHLAYNLACVGIEKNGHVTDRPEASKLVGSLTQALALRRREIKANPLRSGGAKPRGLLELAWRR